MLSQAEKQAVKLLYFLWKSIDHEGMGMTRRMGLWDEFQSKIKFAANARTPERFLEIFARKFGIAAFRKTEIIKFLTDENIETIREKPRKMVLLLRNIIEIEKEEWKANKKKLDWEELYEKIQG